MPLAKEGRADQDNLSGEVFRLLCTGLMEMGSKMFTRIENGHDTLDPASHDQQIRSDPITCHGFAQQDQRP
jgi:hypothetical protein